jgi:putative RNA ligase
LHVLKEETVTKLSDLMDMGLLDEMLRGGYVRSQSHPSLPYDILNYTEKAQFDRVWNEATRQCRGLIVHTEDSTVIARPFPKFFNHGEPGAAELDLDAPAHISDKLDGSLGILFIGNGREIATRGSFTSEQAAHATELLRAKYPHFVPQDGITYLYEILYPQNRIVLDYGDTDDLILLGGVDIATGSIFAPDLLAGWPGPMADVLGAGTLREALKLPPRPNAEGVVARIRDAMVKLKQEDYVALHRVLTNTSARVIWEHLAVQACRDYITKPKDWATLLRMDPRRADQVLAAGSDWAEKMIHGVPDEFYGWFRDTITRLVAQVDDTRDAVMTTFAELKAAHGDDRKGFAIAAKEYPYAGLLFYLLDGADITPYLWRDAYPPAEKPWGQRSEDVS